MASKTKSGKKATAKPAARRGAAATKAKRGAAKATRKPATREKVKAKAPKVVVAKAARAASPPAAPPPADDSPASARVPSPAGDEAMLESYVALLEEIWHDVHPLIGAVTLSALFKSAARRLAPAHPCVAGFEVTIEGIDRIAVRRLLASVSPKEGAAALRDLVRDLLTLFESIAGAVIVRMLLPKIVRAEKGAA